jgi:hypothetical protein
VSGEDGAGTTERPFLRVVRGDPKPEEIAALVAVLTARARAAAAARTPPPGRRSAWADRAGQLRRPLTHGPGAWRAGSMPR